MYEFLEALGRKMELIAPVKTDVARFEPVTDVSKIYLDKNTYLPAKEYFFHKEEVLFSFSGTKLTVPAFEVKERAFFGLRRCDLNGIRHQDMVFLQDGNDPYYKSARDKSLLLGYHCNTAPSPYCFCESLDLVDFFDLMFYERGDLVLIEVGSDKGEKLIKRFSKYFSPHNRRITQEEKQIPGADRLETTDITSFYDHPDWKKGVDQCLSCGACTALCPTCYCFEIHDETKLTDHTKGERKRSWSSCQVQEFTKVAGGHVFRKEREERFKHRIYHQLDYFKDKYGVDLCVGCGRCIEGCPTRIDFVKIINGMHNGKKNA
ncbi:MAG: 4Fe-4S dicluster domain-containing protein [archaeon]